MNILICSLQGTGKTTLSKMIAEKFGFNYINDYSIFNIRNVHTKSEIVNFINSNDNYIIDLCYTLTPSDSSKLNCITLFFGFSSIEPEILYKLMREKGENITLSQIEDNKTKSSNFKKIVKNLIYHFMI